ncbi:MAG: nitrile hydratase subunit beta [Alphaproteobacteria bacterium]|nr:nitrile hydratase subunit beta [Alphaproteobacteria bacterium]
MSVTFAIPAEAAVLRVGQEVHVLPEAPPMSVGKPHIRTPFYIRGKTGVVAVAVGSFRNPETLALGGDGLPTQPLYRVRFMQRDIWPDYSGRPDDSIDIEIYQHWLVSAA